MSNVRAPSLVLPRLPSRHGARHHPLQRLLAGVGFVGLAVALTAASGYFQAAAKGLSVAAVVLLFAALGCFLASVFALLFNVWRRYAEGHPLPAYRLHLALGVAILLFLGSYGCWMAVSGFLSDTAPVISRHTGVVPRRESEGYFWLSLAFHWCMGVFLIAAALWGATRAWVLRRRGP